MTVWFSDTFSGPGPLVNNRSVEYQPPWLSKGDVEWYSGDSVSEGGGVVCAGPEDGVVYMELNSTGGGYQFGELPQARAGQVSLDVEFGTVPGSSYVMTELTALYNYTGFSNIVAPVAADGLTSYRMQLGYVDVSTFLPPGSTEDLVDAGLDTVPGWELEFPNLRNDFIDAINAWRFTLTSLGPYCLVAQLLGLAAGKTDDFIGGALPYSGGPFTAAMYNAQAQGLLAHPSWYQLVTVQSPSPAPFSAFDYGFEVNLLAWLPLELVGTYELSETMFSYDNTTLPLPNPVGEPNYAINDAFTFRNSCVSRYGFDVDLLSGAGFIAKRKTLNPQTSTVGAGLSSLGGKLRR